MLFPVRLLIIFSFCFICSYSIGQSSQTLLKTRYNECVSTWGYDSLSKVIISNVKLPNDSVALAIEVTVHDRDPEQGLRSWIEADTIVIASKRDTLWITEFIRDTLGFYTGKN